MTEHPDVHDCSDVLAQVYQFHDHALSEDEADAIREHLMACEPCLDRYDVEHALRILIRRCCTAERAPDTLRVRVRAQITSTTVIITDEFR